jgi:hypothetical protein
MSIQPYQPSTTLPALLFPEAAQPSRALRQRVGHTQEDAVVAVHRVVASSFVASVGLSEIERLSLREVQIVNSFPGDIEQRYQLAARLAPIVNMVAEVSFQEVRRVGTCPRTVRGCRS